LGNLFSRGEVVTRDSAGVGIGADMLREARKTSVKVAIAAKGLPVAGVANHAAIPPDLGTTRPRGREMEGRLCHAQDLVFILARDEAEVLRRS
jgi:hypothetical protein